MNENRRILKTFYQEKGFHWGFLFLLLIFLITQANANQYKNDCSQNINKARAKYKSYSYDEAERLLKDCLNKGIKNQEIHELLALISLDTHQEQKAKLRVYNLLKNFPRYQPDPHKVNQQYLSLVREVRLDIETLSYPSLIPEPFYKKKKWWAIGGGGVIMGIIVAVWPDSEDPEKPLPRPSFPPSQ